MMQRYPKIFANNFIYTLSVTFLLTSLIQYTGVMRSPDKKIIGTLINIDEYMKQNQITNDNIDDKLSEQFAFSEKVLNGKCILFWILILSSL